MIYLFHLSVKPLKFSVNIGNTAGVSFSFIRVYCRLLPWQQAIVKITIFLLFSTCLLPFLELGSVKYLEARRSSGNDFYDNTLIQTIKNLCKEFLKIFQFPIFDLKKSLDKILPKHDIMK